MYSKLALLFLCAAAGAGAHAADFTPCIDAATQPALAGSLCAIETVPADPSSAIKNSATVALFIRKFPTPEPTRRGTGLSTRLCPFEEAPDSPGGTALAGAEWGTCFGRLNAQPAWARLFSGANAARDLKLLVERTPRHGQTILYGVSYGTGLVLRTLALGIAPVDKVVLDSLVPLQDDATADLSRRSLVVDAVGRAQLADCDASRVCSARMGEPVETIYRRVLAHAAADPTFQATIPGKDLKRLLGNLLDIPQAAASIPYIVKELDTGHDTRLQATLALVERDMNGLGTFPQSPSSIPLVAIMSGSETNLRLGLTKQAVTDEEAGLLFTSALPGLLVDPGLPLYPRDLAADRLPAHLPPTLVIQGRHDAKTPYAAALRHVAVMRTAGPVQIVSDADGTHFALWHPYACLEAAISAFVRGVDNRCVAVTARE